MSFLFGRRKHVSASQVLYSIRANISDQNSNNFFHICICVVYPQNPIPGYILFLVYVWAGIFMRVFVSNKMRLASSIHHNQLSRTKSPNNDLLKYFLFNKHKYLLKKRHHHYHIQNKPNYAREILRIFKIEPSPSSYCAELMMMPRACVPLDLYEIYICVFVYGWRRIRSDAFGAMMLAAWK